MPQYRQADEDKLTGMVLDAIRTQAKGIAALLGPAPDSVGVAGQKEAEMWNYRDQTVDPVALVQQGATPEEATMRAYPFRGPMLMAVASEDEPEKRIAYAKRMKAMSEGQPADEPAMPMEGGY